MYDDTQARLHKRLKWAIIISVVVIILVVAFVIISNSSRVLVTVSNASSGDVTYSFTDQKSGKTTQKTTDATTYKQSLHKGDYQLTVTQDGNSYFTIVHAKGFFSTTSVTASLSSEKARRFVGTNPSKCMVLISGQLVSYDCGALFSDLRIHEAATASQPTYVLNNPNNKFYGNVRGSINLAGKTYLLMQATSPEAAGQGGYALYGVDSNLGFTGSPIQLGSLNSGSTYSIMPYQNGFLVYNTSFTELHYYPGLGSASQSIHIPQPTDGSLQPTSLTANGSSLAAVFATQVNGDTVDNPKSEVVTYVDGNTHAHTFDAIFAAAQMCGPDAFCAINNKTMTAYTADSFAPLYNIANAIDLSTSDDTPLVVTKQGVLSLDLEHKTGYLSYSLGSYGYCGIQPAFGGYLVCVQDKETNRLALFVNPSADNADSIDKKVYDLEKLSQIKNVSINGNFIYIDSNVPYKDVNGISGVFPDPKAQKTIHAQIDDQIKKLGIDRSVYTVVYTE